MTKDREHSDLRQGDLVFRGRLRVPISGRTHHLRHLQERTKLQQRLDIEGKNSTSTYLREVLTQLYAFYDPVGPADGTEILKHPRADHLAKAMGFNCFRAFSAGSSGPLDFQGSGLLEQSPEPYPVRQTGSPDATRIQNIQKNEFLERYRVLFERRVPRGLTRSDIGVITEIMDGTGEHDEPHVKVLLANCTEEIWDRDAVTYAGKLNRQKGKVIVKWQWIRPKGVAEHQEWPMFAVTEMGFALVRDSWGKPHCLPPRDALGDVRYELRHLDTCYLIAMQTIC